jgi:hypothetical protein
VKLRRVRRFTKKNCSPRVLFAASGLPMKPKILTMVVSSSTGTNFSL